MNWVIIFPDNGPKPQMDGQTSFSMNKPTTWWKSGRVSLVSSSCLYKTQPERALAQVCHTRIDALSPDEYQFHILLHRNSHHSQATYPNWLNHFNQSRKPWGDVLRTLSAHGYSKLWRTSFSMNKPTTWCKSGRVSSVSSSCLYKTDRQMDGRSLFLICPLPTSSAGTTIQVIIRTPNTNEWVPSQVR